MGSALVDHFLSRGDSVATFSRTPTEPIERFTAQAGPRFLYSAFDATDRAATAAFVKRAVEAFGGIDVLINNAGVAREGVLGLLSERDLDEVVDLNLKAPLHLTKLVIRSMLLRRWGRVVNISSIIGLSGYRGLTVYSATKAALDGFTRSLAREVGARNITVNSVAPGYLRTEMTHGLSGPQLDQIVRRTPSGRLGEPADVVALVDFLVSRDAGFITGQTIVVDGGLTA